MRRRLAHLALALAVSGCQRDPNAPPQPDRHRPLPMCGAEPATSSGYRGPSRLERIEREDELKVRRERALQGDTTILPSLRLDLFLETFFAVVDCQASGKDPS